MSNLREQLIRLAYERPELRGKLLPFLSGRTAAGDPKKSLPAFRMYIVRWYLNQGLPRPDRGTPFNYAGQDEVFSTLEESIQRSTLPDAVRDLKVPAEALEELLSVVTEFYKRKKKTNLQYPTYLKRMYQRLSENNAVAEADIPKNVLTWKPSKKEFSSMGGSSQKLLLDRIEALLTHDGKFDTVIKATFASDPWSEATERYLKHFNSRPVSEWKSIAKILKMRAIVSDLHHSRRWDQLLELVTLILRAERIPAIREDSQAKKDAARKASTEAWIKRYKPRVSERSATHVTFKVSAPGDRSKKDQRAFIDKIRADIDRDRPRWVSGPTVEDWDSEVLLTYTF